MARTWRWWHVLLAGVGGAVVLGLLGVVLVGVLLLRVLSDLGTPGPEEDDPEVVAARDTATSALAADADRLTVAVLTPALGPGAQRVGRGQVLPPCDVGQHNWKVDDDYDLACDLQRIEVVAAPRRETFTADMRALDVALRAEGWMPSPGRDVEDVVLDWNRRVAPPAGVPGASPSPSAGPAVTVAALPGMTYTRTVAGEPRSLGVRWTAHGSAADSVSWWADDREHAELRTAGGDRAHVSYILEAIPVDGYAVVATEGVEYFRQ